MFFGFNIWYSCQPLEVIPSAPELMFSIEVLTVNKLRPRVYRMTQTDCFFLRLCEWHALKFNIFILADGSTFRARKHDIYILQVGRKQKKELKGKRALNNFLLLLTCRALQCSRYEVRVISRQSRLPTLLACLWVACYNS